MQDPTTLSLAIDELTLSQRYARIEQDNPGTRCVLVQAKDDQPEVAHSAKALSEHHAERAAQLMGWRR